MPRTRYNWFEFPPAEYPLWKEKGMQRASLSEDAQRNIPPEIFEQEFEGYVDWLERLELSITGVVNTRGDLPDPDPEATYVYENPQEDRATQRRLFVILHENVLVYDDGQQWVTLAGRGRRDARVPPIHTEEVTARSGEIDRVRTEDVNTNALRKNGNEAYAPELIEYYNHEDEGNDGQALDLTIDTRDYRDSGDVLVKAHFRTTSTRGPATVFLRVAGYDGTQYHQVNMSGTGITSQADETEWELGRLVQEFGEFSCHYTITRPRNRPLIHGDASAGSSAFTDPILQRGAIRGGDVFRINTIELFTDGTITGAQVEVYGKAQGEFDSF
jgi:hypothetical protein